MDGSMNDSLDDDDHGYVNFAAQFKALRNQNHIGDKAKKLPPDELNDPIIVPCVKLSEEPKQPKIVAVGLPLTVNTEKVTSIPKYNLRRIKNRVKYDADNDLEITSVEVLEKSKSDSIAEILDDSNDLVDSSENGDNEKYEINVKVLWRSDAIHRFTIQQHENLQKVFQYFADFEKISIDRVLITKKEKSILCTDTPASIQLSVIDILEGGIVEQNKVHENSTESTIEEDICQIKVQSSSKQFFIIPLKKKDTMESLIVACAKQLDVQTSQIKLYLDGEPIDMNDTPESLDFDQEACIDLRVII